MSLKEKICNWLISRKVSELKRRNTFQNLHDAQSVGIIFNASHQDLFLTTQKFVEILAAKNKTVRAIGYVLNKKTLEYFDTHAHIKFFWAYDSSWLCKPKNADVIQFADTNFDMLIDLTPADLVQIRYIVAISKASFKVGREILHKNIYDFILKQDETKKLTHFIDQVIHYLTTIKSVASRS